MPRIAVGSQIKEGSRRGKVVAHRPQRMVDVQFEDVSFVERRPESGLRTSNPAGPDDTFDPDKEQLRRVAAAIYTKQRKAGKRHKEAQRSAYAIATRQLQRHGYLEHGSQTPTEKGRTRAAEKRATPDAAMKRQRYEVMLSRSRKSGRYRVVPEDRNGGRVYTIQPSGKWYHDRERAQEVADGWNEARTLSPKHARPARMAANPRVDYEWPKKIGRYKLRMVENRGYGDDTAAYGPFHIRHSRYVPSPSDWHARWDAPDRWQLDMVGERGQRGQHLGYHDSPQAAVSALRYHLSRGGGRSPSKVSSYSVQVSISPSEGLTEKGREWAMEGVDETEFSFEVQSTWPRLAEAVEKGLKREPGGRWMVMGPEKVRGGWVFEIHRHHLAGTATVRRVNPRRRENPRVGRYVVYVTPSGTGRGRVVGTIVFARDPDGYPETPRSIARNVYGHLRETPRSRIRVKYEDEASERDLELALAREWKNRNLNNPRSRKKESKRAFVERVWSERAPRLPSHSYGPRRGLEGPFQFRSGKVLYYDPREGAYYDPDSDMYLSDAEAEAFIVNPRRKNPKFVVGDKVKYSADGLRSRPERGHLRGVITAAPPEGVPNAPDCYSVDWTFYDEIITTVEKPRNLVAANPRRRKNWVPLALGVTASVATLGDIGHREYKKRKKKKREARAALGLENPRSRDEMGGMAKGAASAHAAVRNAQSRARILGREKGDLLWDFELLPPSNKRRWQEERRRVLEDIDAVDLRMHEVSAGVSHLMQDYGPLSPAQKKQVSRLWTLYNSEANDTVLEKENMRARKRARRAKNPYRRNAKVWAGKNKIGYYWAGIRSAGSNDYMNPTVSYQYEPDGRGYYLFVFDPGRGRNRRRGDMLKKMVREVGGWKREPSITNLIFADIIDPRTGKSPKRYKLAKLKARADYLIVGPDGPHRQRWTNKKEAQKEVNRLNRKAVRAFLGFAGDPIVGYRTSNEKAVRKLVAMLYDRNYAFEMGPNVLKRAELPEPAASKKAGRKPPSRKKAGRRLSAIDAELAEIEGKLRKNSRRRNGGRAHKVVPISLAVYNVYQQYWEGQGDPLYAVLSRRAQARSGRPSADWELVAVSREELARLREVTRDILRDPDAPKPHKRTARAFSRTTAIPARRNSYVAAAKAAAQTPLGKKVLAEAAIMATMVVGDRLMRSGKVNKRVIKRMQSKIEKELDYRPTAKEVEKMVEAMPAAADGEITTAELDRVVEDAKEQLKPKTNRRRRRRNR